MAEELTRWHKKGNFATAPGRAPIDVGGFTLGVTKPLLAGSGVPGGITLQGPAAAGLATESNGDIVITDAYHTAHAVGGVLRLVGLDIFGFVKVRTGRRVEIVYCRVRGSGPGSTRTGLIDCNHGNVGSLGTQNVLVEQCTLIPDYPSEWIDGIVGHDYRLVRCLIRNTCDHWGAFNSVRPGDPLRVDIEGNYCVDLAYFSPSVTHQATDNRTHNDSGQHQGNAGLRVVGNLLHANASATAGNGFSATDPTAPAKNTYAPSVTGQALGFTPNVSAVVATVDRNWIDYGAQSITAITAAYACTVTITGNRFGRNQPLLTKNGVAARRAMLIEPAVSAPGLPTSTGPDLSNGNVYEDDGQPVTVHRFKDGT